LIISINTNITEKVYCLHYNTDITNNFISIVKSKNIDILSVFYINFNSCNALTFLSFTIAMAFFNNILAFLYLASRSSNDVSLVLSPHAFSLCNLREFNVISRRILLCTLNLGNGYDFFTKPPPILQYLQK